MTTLETLCRAVCKAKLINPDDCVMGTASVNSDGSGFSECYRYAWEDQKSTVCAVLGALRELNDGTIRAILDEAG